MAFAATRTCLRLVALAARLHDYDELMNNQKP